MPGHPPNTVIAQFFPHARVLGLSPYGSGHINDTYRLRIGNGSAEEEFLMQRLNHEVFREPEKVMANIRRVYEHLAGPAAPECLLRPIAAESGRMLVVDEQGQFWRVFPFFADTFSPGRVDSEEQASHAARAIGRFLYRMSTLDAQCLEFTIPDFHNSLKRLVYFQDIIDRNPAGRLDSVRKEVGQVLDNKGLFEKIAGLDLPVRAVHNDAKLSNVLFKRSTGEACGVIDWDTIMPGILLSDFGDLVRSAASPVDEDEPEAGRAILSLPVFRALCQGFIPEIRDCLTPVERENLVLGPAWITLEQAMRFLGDYLAGDHYYKVRYPGHNLVRTRNQLALFESMLRSQEEMQKIIQSFL